MTFRAYNAITVKLESKYSFFIFCDKILSVPVDTIVGKCMCLAFFRDGLLMATLPIEQIKQIEFFESLDNDRIIVMKPDSFDNI